MSTVKNVEKAGRQVWLAGLGAVLLGKEYAVKKLDEMFEGTNSLVNQVVTKGQEIEGDLKGKLSGAGNYSLKNSFVQDEKIVELREKLGLNQESKQDKISRLAAKVDALTDIVATISVKLEEEKAAVAKKSAKVSTSTTAETKEAAPKSSAKPAATRKPRATASKAAAVNKTASATATKKPATTRKATVAKSTTAKPATAKTTTAKTTTAKEVPSKATESDQSKTDKE